MSITIFMTESTDGIIERVRYFNAKGKMMTADISVLKLKTDSVDNERLVSIIEAAEYSMEVK
jgi:hypothetical protein